MLNITRTKYILPNCLIFFFEDFLQTKVDIVRLIRGNPCIVKTNNSDTLLHIPEGIYAALLGNIHTDPSKFLHHIPRNDCLVAPICEYHLQPFIGRSLPNNAMYRIQVPHIVRNVSEVEKLIRISHGNIHMSSVITVQHLEGNTFEIDEKFITINTSHFSGFIITAEGIKCCSSSANLLLFGSLANNLEMGPLVTVRAYLASIHSENKNHLSVSIRGGRKQIVVKFVSSCKDASANLDRMCQTQMSLC